MIAEPKACAIVFGGKDASQIDLTAGINGLRGAPAYFSAFETAPACLEVDRFLDRESGGLIEREGPKDVPLHHGHEPCVNRSQLGYRLRRQLVAGGEFIEDGRGLIANLDDRRCGSLAQIGALVGQAAKVNLESANIRQRSQCLRRLEARRGRF